MASPQKENTSPSAARGHGFGVAPVFLASICTILGAMMFLRFGYAVGHLGVVGALWVVLLGHLVTIPTAMAISEIATNRRVEGGGEYFMISRSFGTTIGGAIGISLYLSQAISVAFYMIAFGEALRPLLERLEASYGFAADIRLVSLPATAILLGIIYKKGAAMGVRGLWVVFGILAVSLVVFFLGRGTPDAPDELPLTSQLSDPDNFTLVFAIVFPAFTGMTAGVGLSGDLRNPGRAIPLGTLAGTLVGMVVYVLIIVKLAVSASPEELAGEQMVMAKVALWGPIIYLGLAAATLSSALASILIAPRTLQALSRDRVLPGVRLNAFFARGRGPAREPLAAMLLTAMVAIGFVAMGSIDFVAQIISMFFMVTYGALCSVSFLEHFSGNPSYRPTFRSRWYISLLGAVMCFMMMFQMQPLYALLALILMSSIYWGLKRRRRGERDLAAILQGVMFQLTRHMHISLQQSGGGEHAEWRPSIVAFTRRSLERLSHFDLLRWLCHRHGFGEFIHYIPGHLDPESKKKSRAVLDKLIERTEVSRAGVFVEAVVAPSFKTALAQAVQLPGISGLPNNTVLFEFVPDESEEVDEVIEGVRLVAPLGFNVLVLRSSDARFGYRRHIHLWLTRDDLDNAPLMILLAYILLGHSDWEKAEITVFACYPEKLLEEEQEKLNLMIAEGRLPIPPQRVTAVPYSSESSFEKAAAERSAEADLVMLGLTRKEIEKDTKKVLLSHAGLRDVLFVSANEKISIS
jgi:amino acid transporter